MAVISPECFARIRAVLGEQAEDDIAWSNSTGVPESADHFAQEAIFVVCNSGMRFTVARGIYDRCVAALLEGRPVREVFGHKGKAEAIETIWRERDRLLAAYKALATDAERLDMLASLPWIGGITKYHLAKNFGMNVAKPDVHLQRLADREGCTAQALCERIGAACGLRAAAVDVVLWRACALGVINSRTGEVLP